MKLEEIRRAVFDPTRTYRYKLWRRWTEGKMVAWVMLNPSTADELTDDATIRRCIDFSQRWGYGGMEVYNLFAYRATNPKKLLSVEAVGPRNDAYLAAIPVMQRVVVAWGAFPKFLGERDHQVLDILEEDSVRCLGMTSEGYPKHPVRLARRTQLEMYIRRKK